MSVIKNEKQRTYSNNLGQNRSLNAKFNYLLRVLRIK